MTKFKYDKQARKVSTLRRWLEIALDGGFDLGLRHSEFVAALARVSAKYARAHESLLAGRKAGAPRRLTPEDRRLEVAILREGRARRKVLGDEAVIKHAKKRFLLEGNRKLKDSVIERMLSNALPDSQALDEPNYGP